MSGLTVAGLIESAALRLRAAGVTKPRREAHRLWAWQNRVDVGQSYLGPERSPATGPAQAFEIAVERRVRGEPLAYVLGHTGFRRLEIRCDPRALIPRPETEGIVDLALARARTGRALDLGTGTGCLALALADEGDFSEVVAVDRSAPALALAAENVAATGIPVRLVHSDLAAPLRDGRFDLMVSNPPYVTTDELERLDGSVREWEPALALDGGRDGMEVIARIVRGSSPLLVPGGWLVMEVDSTRSDLAAALATAAGWREVRIDGDLYGRDRYLTARRGNETGGGA